MNTRTVTDRVQDWQKKAADKARGVGTATDRCVRQNTWTSIAFAAVLGCIVGYFLANRSD
jgi:ElaB/YqjD/DUF883 family membrane-anchored ribosome-binding protein